MYNGYYLNLHFDIGMILIILASFKGRESMEKKIYGLKSLFILNIIFFSVQSEKMGGAQGAGAGGRRAWGAKGVTVGLV